MAALVVMPLTACDEDDDPVAETIIGTVTGTVSADGEGLSGVAVTLVGAVDDAVATGAGGTYTFTNVPGGSYGVAIDPSSHPDVSWGQTARTTTITVNGETKTVDFPGSFIRTSAITGVVTASGTAIDATVTLTGGPTNVNESTATVGGTYSFTGLRSGSYTVTISAYSGATFATESHNVTVSVGESATVNFAGEATQMAAITGTVTVDNIGTAGVVVSLTGGDLAAAVEIETGLNGVFTFTNLTPGSYTVTVTPPAEDVTFEKGLSKSIDVAAGETGVVNFAGVTPAEPATISIQSITKGGNPVNLSNVYGQIEVAINVTRNDQTLHFVDILIDDVVVATQVFPPPAGAPVEMQATETLVLNVPTTQVEPGTYGWVPAVYNGGREVSANLYVTEQGEDPIPANKVPIILQNYDAVIPGFDFGGDLLFEPDDPTRTAEGTKVNNVTTWYAGDATFSGPQYISFSQVVPSKVYFMVQAAYCSNQPNDVTFSWIPEDATDATDGLGIINQYTAVDCKAELGQVQPDYWNPNTVFPAGAFGPDGTPAKAPIGMSALGAEFSLSDPDPDSPLHVTPRRFLIHPEDVQSGQITAPAKLNLDNLGPTVTLNTVAFDPLWDEQWINADFDLVEGVITEGKDHEDDDVIVLSDGGVGEDDDSREARLANDSTLVDPSSGPDYYVFNCSVDPITNADLLPTLTSSEVDGYRICAYGEDLLGNPAQNQAGNSVFAFSNWFGKDIVKPTIAVADEDRGAFSGFSEPPITFFADSVELNATENIFTIAKPYDDGVDDPRGWGVDASDDAAGFHQNYSTTGDGPLYERVMRYYGETGTMNTVVDTTELEIWLGYQLFVPGETWVRSSDVGFADGASELLADPTAVGTIPGLYYFEAWATDMAGNVGYLARNFVVDQEFGPTLTKVLNPGTYTPGQNGTFQFFGGDDFEADMVQVGMTYSTTIGDINLWYPEQQIDPTADPYDMTYPYDELSPFNYSAGFPGAGILGRVDFTDGAGGLTTIANVDSPHDADADAEVEDMLPWQLFGNVTKDIVGNPTADPPIGPETFVSYDFGGWTDTVPEPWTDELPDFLHFLILDKDNAPVLDFSGTWSNVVAEHMTTKSVVAPFFDAVFLFHNDGVGNVRACAPMAVLTRTDEGVNRYYRYTIASADEKNIPDFCSAGGGTLHAVGIKGAAALVTAIALNVPAPAP
jgi:hypothetical protein